MKLSTKIVGLATSGMMMCASVFGAAAEEGLPLTPDEMATIDQAKTILNCMDLNNIQIETTKKRMMGFVLQGIPPEQRVQILFNEAIEKREDICFEELNIEEESYSKSLDALTQKYGSTNVRAYLGLQ